MALALSSTGVLFPFFSPILGWLGVFLTGSDTSANALFCKLQYTSAEAIGVDPVITVSANASGGVTGKMISPQSIAIGSAAVGLVGKESELFRFTVKHSFIMLGMVCVLTMFSKPHHTPEAKSEAIKVITPEELEKERVKGAVRTDIILSAEIIAIAYSQVADKPLVTQIAVLFSVAIFITAAVYGFVALLVKADDLGLHMSHLYIIEIS